MSYTIIKTASLHYKDQGSDKVYNVNLVKEPPGYKVDFEYGRRGSTLQSGSKTRSHVTLTEAEKIFSKLIGEKLAKGYQDVTTGLASGSVTRVPSKQESGRLPM